ncbi:MAG: TRAP transporter permease [Deltaproteobacteria bacterium]|nr:TRAP transporter permease [Deltaproteobacteria bacterium]MBM4323933.1 TRAP transporter permease [Deltaproteobacteria bacterium]
MTDSKGESRFRRPVGFFGYGEDVLLVSVPMVGIVSILNLPLYLGLSFYIQQYLAVFFGLVMGLVFILVPFKKDAPKDRLPWYDLILSMLGLVVGFYLSIYYKEIVVEMGLLTPLRVILGTIAIVLILEASRRVLGWPFLTIVLLFIFYALFTFLFPGRLYGKGVSWPRLATFLYLDPQGILGIATEVAATIVFAFVFFGQALFRTGGGEFFTDSAMALMGRYRGGPAKVAVLASSLFGTMSGSAVANVVTTGSVTIPLMKKSGYPPYFAGAVEATASSGGQIMPPIMGAAAFLMATFLGMPYGKVALSAAIPAILYYMAVFIQVDLEAAKNGLQGLPSEKLPRLFMVLRKGWLFLIPLGVLIYALFIRVIEADRAGLYATTSVFIICCLRREDRLNLNKIVKILKETGEGMLEIGVICSAAGIIIGIVSLTGLGFTFSQALVTLAGGSTLLLLVLGAVGAIILGMGMTVTAAYLLMVILIAPALVQLGVAPLNAHLFVFYFAVMSFLTPPICLAVYAAASLAGADMMKTAYQAIKLGIGAYIVPFLFAYHPSLLLQGNMFDIIHAVMTAMIGISLVAIGIEGFLFKKLTWVKRILLILGGLGCMIPGWRSDLIGLVIGVPIILWEWRTK